MGCTDSKFDATEEILSSLNELSSLAGLPGCSGHQLKNLPLIRSNPKTILHLTKARLANVAAALEYIAHVHRCIYDARRFFQTNNIQHLAPFDDRVPGSAPAEDAVERRRKIDKKLSFVRRSRWGIRLAGYCAQVIAMVSTVVLTAIGTHPPIASALVNGIDSVQTWLDVSLQRWEEKLEKNRDVLLAFEPGWLVVTNRLESVRVRLHGVKTEFEILTGGEGKKAEMEDKLKDRLNWLEEEAVSCANEIKAAVVDFLSIALNGLLQM